MNDAHFGTAERWLRKAGSAERRAEEADKSDETQYTDDGKRCLGCLRENRTLSVHYLKDGSGMDGMSLLGNGWHIAALFGYVSDSVA